MSYRRKPARDGGPHACGGVHFAQYPMPAWGRQDFLESFFEMCGGGRKEKFLRNLRPARQRGVALGKTFSICFSKCAVGAETGEISTKFAASGFGLGKNFSIFPPNFRGWGERNIFFEESCRRQGRCYYVQGGKLPLGLCRICLCPIRKVESFSKVVVWCSKS